MALRIRNIRDLHNAPRNHDGTYSLRNADLTRADLTGEDLTGADL